MSGERQQAGRRYDGPELARIAEMRASGLSYARIAAATGRSQNALANAVYRYLKPIEGDRTVSYALDRTKVFRTQHRRAEGRNQAFIEARCTACGAVDERSGKPFMPPAAAARFFRIRGWDVDDEGRSATCPACKTKDQATMTTDISTAALKRQRQVFNLLGDHFDEDRGAYAQGWSDARVAKETGIAETAVARTREAAFGPIKASPETLKLAADLAGARARIEGDLEQMRGLLAQLQEDCAHKIASLEGRIQALLKSAA